MVSVAMAVVAMALTAGLTLAPGDVDPTWGNDGLVVLRLPHGGETRDAASTVEGRTVAVGLTGPEGAHSGLVVRYTADGKRDATFGGGDGIAADRLGGGDTRYTSVAMLPDGSVAVAGSTGLYPGGVRNAVARYRPDGSLDPAFGGGDGWVELRPHSCCYIARVGVGPDGTVLAATWSPERSNVYRLTATGDLDPTWGDGGVVQLPVTVTSFLADVDRVVVSGGLAASGGAALVGLRPDGTIDPTFGDQGTTIVNPSGGEYGASFSAVVRRPSGLVATGWSMPGPGEGDVLIAAFDGDGHLDPSFSGDGVVLAPLGPEPDFSTAIGVQPDGAVVVVALDYKPHFHLDSFVAIRLRPNGRPDPSFGEGGVARAPMPGGEGNAPGLALSSRGAVVVGSTPSYALVAVRFLLTG